ncbi:cell division protein FtsQ/DivIB [Herpetosiphon llansteffanensis]|uniref:cell division protein FtsQ/DivIB n=1 Tax=Herpetosiphon llansteffanensis TaxID=2094568 RepID=UPI000D7CA361|nr:FtsQ-type POTRA domain-containing protein [Herpetosiphon llansteffanensis]
MSNPRRTGRMISRKPRGRTALGVRTSTPMVRPTARTILRSMLMNGKLLALFLLLASIGCLIFVFRSPAFVVGNLEIEGNRSVDATTISQLADLQGRSIWDIDPAAVAARIGQNPYVATATVQLRIPARVLVRVQERQAAVVWNVGGTNYEVTAGGEVLGLATSITTATLIIYDTRTIPISAGSYIDTDALNLAQTLYLRIPKELGWQPTRYEWDPYYGLSVYNDTKQAVFGRLAGEPISLDRKLATLQQVQTSDTAWIFIDLRPEKPYYRPQATPTPTEGSQ